MNVGGRPRKIQSPTEFDHLVDEYVSQQQEEERPITWTGMALHLGFYGRDELDNYADYDGFSGSVKRAKAIVQQTYEERMHGNNPTGAIFVLKNMGWSDRQEIESTNRHIITDEAMQEGDWADKYTDE